MSDKQMGMGNNGHGNATKHSSKPHSPEKSSAKRPKDYGKASDATSINPDREEPIMPGSPTLHPA